MDEVFEKARSRKALIIDLRGTPGGATISVADFLNHIFDHEVKIGNWVEWDKVTPMKVKGKGKGAFHGDLIVLVDGETASAGEIFARRVQIEERGTILGDHTSGRTMASWFFMHGTSANAVYGYGDAVTVADAVMSD